MRSSVLVVGHPQPQSLVLGADVVANYEDALTRLKETPYPVVAFALRPGEEDLGYHFALEVEQLTPETQKVLVCPPESSPTLLRLLQSISLCRVVDDFLDPDFEPSLQSAREEHALSQQGLDLFRLFNEQNEKLRSLQENLEQRVLKRQQYLNRAKTKLEKTRQQMEALHSALMTIQGASSLVDLERGLGESLRSYLKLSWVRIAAHTQTSLAQQSSLSLNERIFGVPLTRGAQEVAQVYYARSSEHPEFSPEEEEFLGQLSEAVSLAMDRLIKLEQAESLKQQWEATFNAISAPLCLVDSSFKIIRSNQAFIQAVKRDDTSDPSPVIGQNPLQLIFPEMNSEDIQSLGPRFRFRQTDALRQRTYEVSCQNLDPKHFAQPISILIFRDLTEQLGLERQVLESTKMAELGTIGSSIAHELNNPIGGILSFLQLIKMDLSQEDPLREDIEAMEKATHRCKDIVHNLLGFARHHDLHETQLFSIQEAIHQALKILEFKTRYQNVHFRLNLPEKPYLIKGQVQLLAQAIKNILSNAVEALDQASAQVQIDLTTHQGDYELVIADNGPGIESEILQQIFNPLFTTKNPSLHPGLGLTVAFKIVSEHQGKLEILSQTGVGTKAKITFKCPDSRA